MAWTVEYDPRVEKDLKAIDRVMQREILDYMDTRIATDEGPRRFGKPLRHELRGPWRYRVRDYRIICDIREQTRVVFVLTIKHRSTAHRKPLSTRTAAPGRPASIHPQLAAGTSRTGSREF